MPVEFQTWEDKLIWHYNNDGEYTVKSSYQLSQANEESSSNGLKCGIRGGLIKLWRLRIPSKIRIHLWRALFNGLTCPSEFAK